MQTPDDCPARRLTLAAALWNWTPHPTQRDFLADLIKRGRRCEPFILMDSGGVPDNVTPDRFIAFLDMSAELRK